MIEHKKITIKNKKTKIKIENAWICPTCSNVRVYDQSDTSEQICSECWIKNKKKVKMKKGIFSSSWNSTLLKINNQSLLEKLKDVLERNKGAQSIRIDSDHHSGPFIFFTISTFGSNDLNYIFYYWGIDWKAYVKEYRASPTDIDFELLMERWNSGFYYDEKNEDNNDFYLRVSMWLHKLPDVLNCKHEFKDRSDWQYSICCKCGLFKHIIKEES